MLTEHVALHAVASEPPLMVRWRRVLALYRVRTSTLFVIFCIVGVIYIRTGHKAERQANLRQYAKELLPHSNEYVSPPSFQANTSSSSLIAAVLVICAKRDKAVRNHLDQLIKFRPSPSKFPILISQDGSQQDVASVIHSYINDTNEILTQQHTPEGKNNYGKIATHYKWALDQAFFVKNYSHVIITEEDLDISPDFFLYFAATKKLLDEDPSIWCVSAWNDNGGAKLIDRNLSHLLWRTDFFPGLGWMLTKQLWAELSPIFPDIFWDDWMRKPETRKNRVCIRPEVSRTAHNMQVAGKGSSKGLYKKYLEAITLPVEPVNFLNLDLSYLRKENYDIKLRRLITEAKPISRDALISGGLSAENAYRTTFANARHYNDVAMKYSLMFDMRSGMPRTAYQGVVTFLVDGARVFLISNLTNLENFGSQSHSETYNPDWEHQGRFLEFARHYCGTKWQGKCDPDDPAMADWMKKRRIKLANWGKMIVI